MINNVVHDSVVFDIETDWQGSTCSSAKALADWSEVKKTITELMSIAQESGIRVSLEPSIATMYPETLDWRSETLDDTMMYRKRKREPSVYELLAEIEP